MYLEDKMDTLGVAIRDLDARRATHDEIEEILRLMYAHKIVVLKDQALSAQEYVDFSKRLGEPVPYLQENYHHPDHPLIFVSSNVELNGRKVGVARTGGYWHSDTAFQEEPVPLTMLYPQVVPKNTTRTTLFIDLERVYRSLPAELKARVDRSTFLHSGRWRYKVREQDAGYDISEILATIDRVQPPARHPAVIVHPVTMERVLYATRGFTVGVAGASPHEGQALLDELFDFMEQEQFVATFKWERGDIILWDNRFLAHRAGRQASAEGVVTEEDTMVFRIMMNDGHAMYLSPAAQRSHRENENENEKKKEEEIPC